jgi:hypothetical protein
MKAPTLIDYGAPGTWKDALQADHRSLKFLTDKELAAPDIIDRVQRWHGLTYAYQANNMIAAERKRRIGGSYEGKLVYSTDKRAKDHPFGGQP